LLFVGLEFLAAACLQRAFGHLVEGYRLLYDGRSPVFGI
jgi:hypothetical protein